jgi:hypothetical protein
MMQPVWFPGPTIVDFISKRYSNVREVCILIRIITCRKASGSNSCSASQGKQPYMESEGSLPFFMIPPCLCLFLRLKINRLTHTDGKKFLFFIYNYTLHVSTENGHHQVIYTNKLKCIYCKSKFVKNVKAYKNAEKILN